MQHIVCGPGKISILIDFSHTKPNLIRAIPSKMSLTYKLKTSS